MMLQKKYSLKKHNTLGIEVNANSFFAFDSVESLEDFAQKEIFIDTDLFILGGGSNVLFTKDFEGLVLHSKILTKQITNESNHSILIEAGSGIEWDDFVSYCVKNKYYGVENLSLIPGNIGAAPVQNIGAYGTEAKDHIVGVHAYDLIKKERIYFTNEDCNFSYRNSIFKNKEYKKIIITSVIFKLSKLPPYKLKIRAYEGSIITKQLKHIVTVLRDTYKAVRTLKVNFKKKSISVDYRCLKAVFENTGLMSIEKVRQTIINKRSSKLPNPKEVGNVGSFFKNSIIDIAKAEKIKSKYPKVVLYPLSDNEVKISSGWLIAQCGWQEKNNNNNSVGLYRDQTLVIINKGGATGIEIVNYSEEIKKSVFKKFGIQLEEEVVII